MKAEQGGNLSENDLKDRVHGEQVAHTENDVLANSYQLKNRFKHIWTYPSRKRHDKRMFGIFERS